jgi:uncharacterized protein YciI
MKGCDGIGSGRWGGCRPVKLAKSGVGFVSCLALAVLAGCAEIPTDRTETGVVRPARTGELFLFIYAPGPAWKDGVPLSRQGLAPHGAYMQELLSQGRLHADGGFVSDRGGMAIVIARDIGEAQAMLAADPAITSGIFSATLEHWRPRFRMDEPLPRRE